MHATGKREIHSYIASKKQGMMNIQELSALHLPCRYSWKSWQQSSRGFLMTCGSTSRWMASRVLMTRHLANLLVWALDSYPALQDSQSGQPWLPQVIPTSRFYVGRWVFFPSAIWRLFPFGLINGPWYIASSPTWMRVSVRLKSWGICSTSDDTLRANKLGLLYEHSVQRYAKMMPQGLP